MYNKYFCKNIENVENYEEAKADNFEGWHLHHRLQTWTSDGKRRLVDITVSELKALGMYYHRPANELIFLTKAEHLKLHLKGKLKTKEHKNRISNSLKGKQHSVETKNKISEKRKGRRPMLGKQHSDETKKKLGKNSKRRHWYNNGKENKFCYECPEGFVIGMLNR